MHCQQETFITHCHRETFITHCHQETFITHCHQETFITYWHKYTVEHSHTGIRKYMLQAGNRMDLLHIDTSTERCITCTLVLQWQCPFKIK